VTTQRLVAAPCEHDRFGFFASLPSDLPEKPQANLPRRPHI